MSFDVVLRMRVCKVHLLGAVCVRVRALPPFLLGVILIRRREVAHGKPQGGLDMVVRYGLWPCRQHSSGII